MAKTNNKGGRPTTYNDEVAALLLGYISRGESLNRACRHEGMPAPSTFYLWLQDHKDFSERYARACLERSDAMAEEILEIADLETEDVQRSRLRVDTRKWLMSKMVPKKYGDAQKIELSGKVEAARPYDGLTIDEIRQALQQRTTDEPAPTGD